MPLRATADLYSGLAIDQASLAEDPEAFDKQLEKALAEWKAAGKKAVWVTIPSRLVGLIPVAAARGFEFHNAEAGKGAMMVAWLPGGEHNLPQPCTHYVGVGVAVVDAQGRILVVQEKAGPAAARGKDFWKVPTGLVDAGEDIATAAEREVWEETGIRVRFEGVISFRQQHKAGVQQKTDLFFLCKATPLSTEINACATEIARAEWMPLKHFLSTSPLPEGSAYWFMNRLAAESFLAGKGDIGGVRLTKSPAIFAPSKLPRGFGGSSTNLIFSDAGTPPPSLLAKPTDAPPAPRPRL